MHMRWVVIVAALVAANFAGGCRSSDGDPASSGPNPADNLRLVAHGTNQELKFKADHAGTIFVSDFTTGGSYLYTGALKAGDVFILEPDSSLATINKSPAYLDHDTNTHDEYRLYFIDK